MDWMFDRKVEYRNEKNSKIANNKELVLLYPNPVNNTINIDINVNNFSGIIYIFDVFGNKVFVEDVYQSNLKVDVSLYTDGLYILSIQDIKGSIIATKKFLINHN